MPSTNLGYHKVNQSIYLSDFGGTPEKYLRSKAAREGGRMDDAQLSSPIEREEKGFWVNNFGVRETARTIS